MGIARGSATLIHHHFPQKKKNLAKPTPYQAWVLPTGGVQLVQPLLFLQHFPEEWCHPRAIEDGGVKNNTNKLNRNSGGPQEGLRWGFWGWRGGGPKQSAPLSFQPPKWRILQKKNDTVLSTTIVRVSAVHQLS